MKNKCWLNETVKTKHLFNILDFFQMKLAKLPNLYVMVKGLSNEYINAYFRIFTNEIFYMLIYKSHQPIYHKQIPKMSKTFIYEPAWQSTNHHIQKFAKLAKHLGKPF